MKNYVVVLHTGDSIKISADSVAFMDGLYFYKKDSNEPIAAVSQYLYFKEVA